MKHIPFLDGVRALAVMVVLAFHCRVPGFDGGFLGVDVFFVLSGFLITTMLAKESAEKERIQFRQFYMQRALRLTPALVVMLAAYTALASLTNSNWSTATHWRDATLAALYLSDYAMAFWHVPNLIGHTWSLSVEEHYYLLWPLVLVFGLRLKRAWLIALLVFFYFADMVWRDTVFLQAGWQEAYYRFDTRLTGLLLGGISALSAPQLPQRWAAPLSTLGLAIIFAAESLRWGNAATVIWGIPAVELASALLILGALNNTDSLTTRILAFRPIAFIGTISYAIYLWHYPIAKLLRDQWPWYQTLPVTLTLSLALATASYFLIEKPINRWRKSRRLEQNKARNLIRPTLAPQAVR